MTCKTCVKCIQWVLLEKKLSLSVAAGEADKVLCFRCGGGMKGWQPEEDPWVEHAKYYPG